MTSRRATFRNLFIWPKPQEIANPRSPHIPQKSDEDAVYKGRLHGRRVRLLRLLPESTKDSLQYDLNDYDLDAKVSFEALSYSWGDPTQRHSITCNGKEVQIAENLYSALQQFQEDGYHSLIWTDALCINQANLDEKTEQVKMMADIYKAASEVIVWLGKETPGDRSGVEMLTLLLDKLGLPLFGKDLAADPRFTHAQYGLPEGGDSRWLDLLGIFKRPWFVRAWTVQEFLFAKRSHIRIGALKLSWDQLFAAAMNATRYTALNTTLFGPRIATQELNNVRNLWILKVSFQPFLFAGAKVTAADKTSLMSTWAAKSLLFVCTQTFKALKVIAKVHMPSWANTKPGLNDVLLATVGHETTNPQDRVFSVLALTHDGRVDKIDYRKDISEVLTDAAKMSLGVDDDPLIALGASLRFMSSIETPSTIPGVPSWVPDYRSHSEFRPMSETGTGSVSMSKPTLNNVNGACEGKYLHLRGRSVDMVASVYQSDAHEHRVANKSTAGKATSERDIAEIYTTSPDIPFKLFEFETECWNIAKSLGTYPTGEPLREAYWQALICEMSELNSGLGFTMKQCFEAYIESLPLIAIMPRLLAEYYGLQLQDGSTDGSDEADNETLPVASEDVAETREAVAEAQIKPEKTTQDPLPDLPTTSATNSDLPPDDQFKLSRVATGLIGEVPAMANLTNETPLPEPAIKPLSRASTFQDIVEEVIEETVEATPRQFSALITSPATPETFTSLGLRVPDCVYTNPERTILQHLQPLTVPLEIFEQRFQSLSTRRRWGTTKSGYMGWFPRLAKEGDLIVVFNGCTTPFVVRRSDVYNDTVGKEEWDGTWKVMGACYVRGFMNAGAFTIAPTEVVISLS